MSRTLAPLALSLIGLLPVAAASPALAQDPAPVTREDLRNRDRDFDKRLDGIERSIKTLREVITQSRLTGQPVEVRIAADPDPELVAAKQRIDDMEQAGRTQNSQIEAVSHDLDQIRRDVKAMRDETKVASDRQAQIFTRLTALEAAAQPVVAAPTPATAFTPAAGPAQPPPAADNAADGYARAKRILLAGDYPGAAAAFQTFVETYPDAPETAEARYWLGEALFVQDEHADAATAYIGAIRGWPATPWAPNAVVRLARSLIALEKPADACRTLGELAKRYPNPSTLVATRAKQARADAKCK